VGRPQALVLLCYKVIGLKHLAADGILEEEWMFLGLLQCNRWKRFTALYARRWFNSGRLLLSTMALGDGSVRARSALV